MADWMRHICEWNIERNLILQTESHPNITDIPGANFGDQKKEPVTDSDIYF